MKIAQELFDKYEILAPSEENSDVFDQHTDCVDYDGFFKALADYKQSILALVDVEIDKHKAMQKKYLDNNLEYYGLAGAKISTLTELKQKIEEIETIGE